jgi:hypothetical protein
VQTPKYFSIDFMEKFKQACADLGGYEADFLYMSAFVSCFLTQLKSPAWTFIGLRASLNISYHDSVLRDILRRCFTLAGRGIIGGIEDEVDSRLDRAIVRLLSDRELEASLLFPHGVDMSEGFLSLSTDMKARLVRFIMQTVFENPTSLTRGSDDIGFPWVAEDSQGNRYFVIKDTTLEIGCWKQMPNHGQVELIAANTETLSVFLLKLRSGLDSPARSKHTCIYCKKRSADNASITCRGCQIGCCHFRCMPPSELSGLPWSCSPTCRELHLIEYLDAFIKEIEPLQKAVMRKRRRLAGEISSLQISTKGFESERRERTSTRERRSSGHIDYSFKDFDRSISEAIKRSERRESAESDEELSPQVRPVSREERMALRHQRFNGVESTHPNPHETNFEENEISPPVEDIPERPSDFALTLSQDGADRLVCDQVDMADEI